MIPFHLEDYERDTLNPLNLANLQYSLASEDLKEFHFPAVESFTTSTSLDTFGLPKTPSITFDDRYLDIDYSSRRMSSSANSVDTDTSSLSRPDKRPFTPDQASPPAPSKRLRPSVSASFEPSGPWSGAEQPPDRVQLPPIFPSAHDHLRNSSLHELRRSSLPALYSENNSATARLSGRSRPQYQQSTLNSYQFPSSESPPYDKMRPRLDTQVGPFNSYGYSSASSAQSSIPSTISNSGSSFTFSSPMSSGPGLTNSYLNSTETWSAPQRPNSNPESERHSVKSEDCVESWSFSHGSDYGQTPPSAVTVSTKAGSTTPPLSSLPSPAAAMAERPKGKRGKLPKLVTDFLKDWLHRHSDHPYPSEDEKKQLCQATGLSMSQVSNWMINARRRILAPAQRAQSNSATSAQFRSPVASTSPAAAAAALSHHSHHRTPSHSNTQSQQHLHPSSYRRASLPTAAPEMQIYYPLSLQSIPTPASSLQHSHSLSSHHPRLSSGGLNDLHSMESYHNNNSGQGQYLGHGSRGSSGGVYTVHESDRRGYNGYGSEGDGHSDFHSGHGGYSH